MADVKDEESTYDSEEETVETTQDNQDIEVEVEIDQSETAEADSVEIESEEDEHQKYTAGVQKRIDRLTKKMREAERQREEALAYAKNVQTESDQLKARVNSLDKGYMTEYGSRLTIEEQQAETELRAAIDRADTEATVVAQRKLTQLAVAKDRYEAAKQQQERQAEQVAQQQASQQPVAQQQVSQQPVPQQQAPDPKAESWASRNEWFGQDEAMTFAAFGLHKRLVENEGFDPKSDEYYSELDARIRNEFPHKFTTNSGKRPVQNVAGNSRSTGGSKTGRRTRKKLTPSQVAIAERLGVPLEEYAKHVK
tara:strand:+ start:1386 stop:2315 length:930 start_codon:yes stop_codon:yes gene_type:complete